MNNEKLTICFHPFMLYTENDDYDAMMAEIAERGFNCVRFDDGAGLLRDKEGNRRNEIFVSAPFGKYTKYTTWRIITDGKSINVSQRLLNACRAAKKNNVKVILSSWFFLHIHWFCDEETINHITEMSTEDKISYFTDDLSLILDLLKKENLIDIVAFVEIFNEFDGLPFCGGYNTEGPGAEETKKLRLLHENAIDKLKERYPETLVGFDTWQVSVDPEFIPRNIDVLNFHCYYSWSIYFVFEQNIVKKSNENIKVPDDIKYYLKDDIIQVSEILNETGNFRNGLDWPPRISLYSSIDESKEDELTALLDKELGDNFDHYMNKLYDGINKIIETHDIVVPKSRLVMGEGATCCISPTLRFERDSEQFWKMINNQMKFLNEKNLWGTVISTSHAPGRIIAWECKEKYIKANSLFLNI